MTIIATDTEANGLFIHKGCQGFTVTACDDDARIYLWKFPINPRTRKVTYDKRKIEDIKKTFLKHKQIVFHHANYDLQVFEAMGIPADWFFDNFDVHDTIVMSHALKSDDPHGLKELCVMYADYPDDDERELTKATQAARIIAKKLGWCIADANNLHDTLLGTQREVFRTDYWVPEAVASHMKYADDHPWRTVCDYYAKKDAERTMVLYLALDHQLRQIKHTSKYRFNHKSGPYTITNTGTLWDKYHEARRLILPLYKMQHVRIPVDVRALQDTIPLFESHQAESLSTMRRLVKDPKFNPRSSKQLQKALFETFKFRPPKLGKSGPSADKEVISKLLSEVRLEGGKVPHKYQFLVALKEYRKETTTLQYLHNYEIHSRNADRTIQPFFSQTRTGTGRLSCTDPNTTNVGKKNMANPFADDKDKTKASLLSELLGIEDDEKFSLRKIFGPRPGEQWTCIDYDQFQLRIFAVVSESYELLEGFERGEDIHSLVARIIFNKDDISDVERTAAKAINFGLLFGAGPAKIELLAGVPGLYNLFMQNFPKARIYLNKQTELARRYGYVHTVGGYRLYVPRSTPYAASCYVIQGTEAEIVKKAMVDLYHAELIVYILMMMVHDELIFKSVTTNFSELRKIMDIMVKAGTDIGIPCKVDAKLVTRSWDQRLPLEFPSRRLPPKKATHANSY